MSRYVLALILVAGCEQAVAPVPDITAHIPWSPWRAPHVGDYYETRFVSSNVTTGKVTHRGEALSAYTTRILAVANEAPTDIRIDVSQHDRTGDGAASGASFVGSYELSGRGLTEIRRLDGPLSVTAGDWLKALWSESACSAADERLLHDRSYVVGQTAHPSPAELNCLGFRNTVGTFDLTLMSTDGETCVFAYSFVHAAQHPDLPPWHTTGMLIYSKHLVVRTRFSVMEANGVRDELMMSTSRRFTPGAP